MSTPEQHLAFQFAEVARFEKELEQLKQWGMPETAGGFQRLGAAIDTAIRKVGQLLPRLTVPIKKLFGFSPGELLLWADAELGWKVEARVSPGAAPVYRQVSDEIAEKIIKESLTHEEFAELISPDPYIGE